MIRDPFYLRRWYLLTTTVACSTSFAGIVAGVAMEGEDGRLVLTVSGLTFASAAGFMVGQILTSRAALGFLRQVLAPDGPILGPLGGTQSHDPAASAARAGVLDRLEEATASRPTLFTSPVVAALVGGAAVVLVAVLSLL